MRRMRVVLKFSFEDKEMSSLFSVLINEGKKIGRKKGPIARVRISKVVEIIMNSVPVYNLRISSVLFRVIVRAYEAKVRVYLLEIQSLVKILSITKRRGEYKKKKGRNMLSMDMGHISSICSSEFDDSQYMDGQIGSYSETLGLVDGYTDQPKRRSKGITDRMTELDIPRMIVSDTSRNAPVISSFEPVRKEPFVVREARKIKPALQNIEIEYSEMSTLGSIERPRNASVHTVRESSSSSVSEERTLDFLSSDTDFNKYAVGGRRRRARIFYLMLELSSRGAFVPVQKQAYGEIVLTKPRP
ncbi:hypothetical protein EROM_080970 [Encephalitozoon romaleae SJ-2008]|uniref:Rad21/Rec8-like protein C-terminal eukaryotic domain-containing protein n=1 Tax=Encephalitozoon romaleae (strain SJ-2008) TaxID=1178016 RepID=I7ASU1_ENCRO|nr:hypothetical protein EROM_080970 [Encephalitozoon romaleae SJ-2008]AFN83512.1 hypothetical protein EROM_080970 [Encephalitozoon romaleae SJ-2008]